MSGHVAATLPSHQRFSYSIIVGLGFAFILYTVYRDPALECRQDEQLQFHPLVGGC